MSHDPAYYRRAEEKLKESFRLAPDNFDARKIAVEILLGKHEYASALKSAKELNARVADDIEVYGFVADAAIKLGRYDEAETAVQWMLDLRHTGAQVFTRIARLRMIFGDTRGAFEAFDFALADTHEAEDRALLLIEIADLASTTGDTDVAEKRLRQALKLLPNHPAALVNLKRVRSKHLR